MRTITYTRDLPVKDNFDVMVAGGGMAGFSAAVNAARKGAKTLLVEKSADLGGMATIGGVSYFCSETRGQGIVFDEILARLERENAIAPHPAFGPENPSRLFDHEILKYILVDMAEASGLTLLLHTRAIDAMTELGRITHVVLENNSGIFAVGVRTAVDCTGVAAVAARIGAALMHGRAGDNLTLPMSIMFFAKKICGNTRPISADPAFRYKTEADLPMTSFWSLLVEKLGVKVKLAGYDAANGDSLSAAEVEARRKIMSVMHYMQTHDYPDYALDYISSSVGIREGRRVVGDYVLRIEDLRAGRAFDDSIAVGYYKLDAMSPDTDKRVYVVDPAGAAVPPYEIPYRCIISRDCSNLFMAGMCFSAEQAALTSARVITTASMLGSAAGLGAAMMADGDVTEHRSIDIDALQDEIMDGGAVVKAPKNVWPAQTRL